MHYKYVTDIVNNLEMEGTLLQAWGKNQSLPYPTQKYHTQIDTLAEETGIEKVDIMFRLKVYAERNLHAHSGDLNRYIEGCRFGEVATTLAKDYARLDEILLKANRERERPQSAKALRGFANLWFEEFDFEAPTPFILTEVALHKTRVFLQDAKQAKKNAEDKALERAALAKKQAEGLKKEMSKKCRETKRPVPS